MKGRYRPMRPDEKARCANCGHIRYVHKGLGTGALCLPNTREVCACRGFVSTEEGSK